MTRQEWIQKRIDFIKGLMEKYPEQIKMEEHHIDMLADIFDSAWANGRSEGMEEAYKNVSEWRKDVYRKSIDSFQ